MKKRVICLLVLALVVVVAVGVYLLVSFSSIFGTPNEQASEALSVEAYAETYLQDYTCSYDAAARTLTLSRTSSLSYADACAFGGNVYADELAPDTYLDQVYSILLDIYAKCSPGELTVLLCYTATDGEPIFSVSSDGTVWTCWGTPEA